MITENTDKARSIAHKARKEDRDKKMSPLDVKVTIPGEGEQAELKRKEIRESNALIQIKIDEASNVDELKKALSEL